MRLNPMDCLHCVFGNLRRDRIEILGRGENVVAEKRKLIPEMQEGGGRDFMRSSLQCSFSR